MLSSQKYNVTNHGFAHIEKLFRYSRSPALSFECDSTPSHATNGLELDFQHTQI